VQRNAPHNPPSPQRGGPLSQTAISAYGNYIRQIRASLVQSGFGTALIYMQIYLQRGAKPTKTQKIAVNYNTDRFSTFNGRYSDC